MQNDPPDSFSVGKDFVPFPKAFLSVITERTTVPSKDDSHPLAANVLGKTFKNHARACVSVPFAELVLGNLRIIVPFSELLVAIACVSLTRAAIYLTRKLIGEPR
jgi:hypothetical protein